MNSDNTILLTEKITENSSNLNTLIEKFDDHVFDEALSTKQLKEKVEFISQTIQNIREYPEAHYDYVELQIEIARDRHSIRMDALKKVVSGSIWAGIVGIATLIYYGVLHTLDKH